MLKKWSVQIFPICDYNTREKAYKIRLLSSGGHSVFESFTYAKKIGAIKAAHNFLKKTGAEMHITEFGSTENIYTSKRYDKTELFRTKILLQNAEKEILELKTLLKGVECEGKRVEQSTESGTQEEEVGQEETI